MKDFFIKLLNMLLSMRTKFTNFSKKLKMAETQEFKGAVGKAGCHIENVGELLQEFDGRFVSEDGKVVKLGTDQVFQLMGMLYNKFAETLLECEGKELTIEFGDSATANLAEQILQFILEQAGKRA